MAKRAVAKAPESHREVGKVKRLEKRIKLPGLMITALLISSCKAIPGAQVSSATHSIQQAAQDPDRLTNYMIAKYDDYLFIPAVICTGLISAAWTYKTLQTILKEKVPHDHGKRI